MNVQSPILINFGNTYLLKVRVFNLEQIKCLLFRTDKFKIYVYNSTNEPRKNLLNCVILHLNIMELVLCALNTYRVRCKAIKIFRKKTC